MATLVDSNVVLDIVEPDSAWRHWATRRVTACRLEGSILFNVVIAAEVAHGFVSETNYATVFREPLWTFEHIPPEAARPAGWAHRDYKVRGGRREQTLPDFLIGAHALVAGHRLLTRDPARYRTYFPDLELIAPDTHP